MNLENGGNRGLKMVTVHNLEDLNTKILEDTLLNNQNVVITSDPEVVRNENEVRAIMGISDVNCFIVPEDTFVSYIKRKFRATKEERGAVYNGSLKLGKRLIRYVITNANAKSSYCIFTREMDRRALYL